MVMRSERGYNNIFLLGVIFIGLLSSVMGIDMGFYYSAQNQLQTAADAGSLAAMNELFNGPEENTALRQYDAMDVANNIVEENLGEDTLEEDEDVMFGYIDPVTKKYDPNHFLQPSADPDYAHTGGYNAVRVAVKRTEDSPAGNLPAVVARMFGVDEMPTSASSVALMDQTVTAIEDGGVRPVYACKAQFQRAMQDGNPENNVARIYGQQFYLDGDTNIPGCPAPASGNWGFSDLRDCDPGVPGADNTASWFRHGYSGRVEVEHCKSSQSGNFLSNVGVTSAMNELIANKTVILLPVIDSWSGSGSNTNVNVDSFVGFVVTGYHNLGPANSRYIEGYFTKAVCNKGCETGGNGPAMGGSVVKLRLAHQ